MSESQVRSSLSSTFASHLDSLLVFGEQQTDTRKRRVFTPLFRTLVTATALHTDILAYYDVPSVTIRDILLPLLLARPDEEIPRWYRQDASLTLDDSKVQQWGGVLVDLLHVRGWFLLFSRPLMFDI